MRYILLDHKAVTSIKGMSNVISVSYEVNDGKSSQSIPCLLTYVHSSTPLKYFLDSAQKMEWENSVKPILSQHETNLLLKKIVELGPQWMADFEIEQLNQPEFSGENQFIASIARTLKHIANKILERKTAFVFPTKWSGASEKLATEMAKSMVKELAVLLSEMPANQEIKYVFLSSGDSNGQNELGSFIRSLHSELLTCKNSLDTSPWIQKSGAILLSGPTGTGKSYAARLIAADEKYQSRLVEVNLAAVQESLLESRMRGYMAGSFTGSDRKGRAGWFEDANGGVLFLDEFQSISMEAQVQLLDLLNAVSDDVYIARIGKEGNRQRFNVKVILAINEDIETLLREKRLRKDIYYRVRLIESFPSLKERLEQDLEHKYLRGLLATYRWKSLRTIEQFSCIEGGLRSMEQTFFPTFLPEALSQLVTQEWEGNFRELERVTFDLFYHCDYKEQEPVINKTNVITAIKSWNLQMNDESEIDSKTHGMTDVELKKLNEIQQTFRESGFVIASVLKNQLYYKSRPPLKKYLRNNIDKLDDDIRSDSRMAKFLS